MAEAKKPKAHVAPHKKTIVKNLVKLFKSYPIIGSINMENLPAPQLQVMKAKLRGQVEMFMTKKRLMKIAIAEAKNDVKGLDLLEAQLKGMPALLFTKENPFSLFKTIKKSKSKAPAKAGQTAPYDLVIPAGPTPFAPGPIIGEFGAMGIKTKVEDGKIAVLNDTVVCKEGDTINEKLAGLLTRLNIKPMEVGLDLVAVLEKGTMFDKKVLDIDEEQFMADLSSCARWGLNLAMDIAYPTSVTSELLVQKAFRDAKGLALSQNIIADAVAEELLAKAHRQMLSLKDTANIEVVEKKVTKEEPKVEEKKEEPKKEEPKKDEPKPEPKAEEKKEAPKEEKKEEAKPEPKPEPPKEEPKKEEPKAELAKEEPKQVEQHKEEPKDDVDKKVAEMVKKTKEFAEGKIPSAEKLVDDVLKE